MTTLVADVVFAGQRDLREALLQCLHDLPSVVDRKRGLGDATELSGIAHLQVLNIFDALDQLHLVAPVPEGSLDFDVARVTDQHDFEVVLEHATGFDVNLGDERAGGVDYFEVALLGLGANRRRDAVGAVDQSRAGRNVREIVDEDRALGAQIFDHVAVVDDFVAHVDGPAEALEGDLDDFDCAVDTRAESAGTGHEDTHRARLAASSGLRRRPLRAPASVSRR